MKKIIALLMALVVLSTSAFASINISLDGQVLEVPEEMGKPFAQDNRTYVPIRFMLEYFGYDVTYSPAEKQVIGTDANGSLFMMQIGNSLLFFKSADANEINKITMDVTPVVDYSIGRIYIPASFLIKEMGHGVEYDKDTKTVVITTKTTTVPTEEVTEEATEDTTEEVAEETTEEITE
ncbi:MAG: copper amine oxidase N-terminal domain-containing protein [Ruminococcaceae bacterium]|nr:copper amine oxidase N-terminal domain-containing protein [Oscillospiraceae bacterium]